MPVRIARTRRHDRHSWLNPLQERARGCRLRAVVRHLEQVERRQATAQQLRVDALLDVAGEQDALSANLTEQHDRDVVDRGAAIRRALRHPVRVGPEDAEVNRIKRQAVASGQPAVGWSAIGERGRPGVVAGTRPDHPGLVHPPDAIALEQRREARDVIFVRVGQHEDVDAAVPRRQALVERHQQPARIRAAIHDHPTAAIPEHEDAVALPDVKDDDVNGAIGSVGEGEREGQRRGNQGDRSDSRGSSGRRFLPVALAGQGRTCRGRRRFRPASPSKAAEDCVAARGSNPDHRSRRDGGHEVPRRLECEAREGKAGADPHRRDHRRVQRPRRQAHERREDARDPETGRDTHDQRERTGGHCRRNQRHHDQVHERRDERQPPEVEQHDRRRRGLRREGHPEDVGDEPAKPAR